MTARIHIQREGAYGYLLPAGADFTLHAADGRMRCKLSGPASAARAEARRIIDSNPKCFPDKRRTQ